MQVRVEPYGYIWSGKHDPNKWYDVLDEYDDLVIVDIDDNIGFSKGSGYAFPQHAIIERKPAFKVGDTVRIRSWESMEEEFGLNDEGDIQAYLLFTTGMRDLEGRVFVIEDIVHERVYGLDEYWDISTDMIEHVDDVKEKIIKEDDVKEKIKNIIKQLEELL